jgi:hypothetical protein
MEEQKKEKGGETSASGINVIEINIVVSSSDSRVFDTRSMIHPCKSLQGRVGCSCRQWSKGCSHSSQHLPPAITLGISFGIKQLLLHSCFM